MRRNFAVGVILILGGISILLLSVLVPHFTEYELILKREYETVPFGAMVLAFVLQVLGLGLVGVEFSTHIFWLFFPAEIPNEVSWFGALHMHVCIYGALVFLETIQTFYLGEKQTRTRIVQQLPSFSILSQTSYRTNSAK